MTNEEFIILAEKVAEGSASIREIALYNASYQSFQQDPQSLTANGLDAKELKKESLARFWKSAAVARAVQRRLWPRVAAAVAAITLGVWFYQPVLNWFQDHPGGSAATRDLYTNDIAPGKNTATLTLANGKVINLSDTKTGVIIDASKLTYNDGTNVNTTSTSPPVGLPSLAGGELQAADNNVQMLTASTPRGGMYQVVLPDGSKLWLNADSKISFPSQFIGDERKILLLYGEVYFEVAKNKQKPFFVETKGQEVEVLGTHFNINAYPDESGIKTTLLEGSVRVNAITLKPNQQAITINKQITIKKVNAAAIIDWKNGEFLFNDEPLESIMRRVARWYNVEVIYRSINPKETFGGSISRFENVSKVLENLELTGGIHFKIEGRKIIVSK